jgi:chorismate mutase/prephenate dehydratase
LLSPLARHSLNMSRIESRPSSATSWSYVFYVDVEGHAETEPRNSALEEMQKQTGMTRVLGSYPKAVSKQHVSDS